MGEPSWSPRRIYFFRIVAVAFVAISAMLSLPLRFDLLLFFAFSMAACLVIARGTSTRAQNYDLPFLWYGLITPLAPFFGAGALLVTGSAVSLLFPRWKNADLVTLLPWLIVVFAGAISTIGPIDGVFSVLEGLRVSLAAIEMTRASLVAYGLQGFERFELWLVFITLLCSLQSNANSRRSMFNGLLIGSVVALFVTIFQAVHVVPLTYFAAQNSFWTGIGRYSGTFSDPNACGVFCMLLLFAAIHLLTKTQSLRSQIGIVVFILVILIAASFAGSRTFFLGSALLVFGLAWSHSSRTLLFSVPIFFLVLISLSFLESFYSLSNQIEGAPVGIIRVLHALDIQRLGESFFNRAVFYYVALIMWADHLLTGVGLSMFARWVPSYSAKLELGLDTWVDNANNFYLGVGAELGVLGIATLILTLSAMRFREDVGRETRYLRVGLLVFACTLLIGPHLDFPEVSSFVACLLSMAVGLRRDTARLRTSFAIAATSVVSLWGNFSEERGTFAPEKSLETEWARWTGPSAEIVIPCNCEDKAEIAYIIHHSRLERPVTIHFRNELGEQVYSAQETSPGKRRVTIQCGERLAAGTAMYAMVSEVHVTVEPAWRPQEFGVGSDDRLLGVQLIGRRPIEVPMRCENKSPVQGR